MRAHRVRDNVVCRAPPEAKTGFTFPGPGATARPVPPRERRAVAGEAEFGHALAPGAYRSATTATR